MNYKDFMALREADNDETKIKETESDINNAKEELRKAGDKLSRDNNLSSFEETFAKIKDALGDSDDIRKINDILKSKGVVTEDITDKAAAKGITDEAAAKEITSLIDNFLQTETIDKDDIYENEKKLLQILNATKDISLTDENVTKILQISTEAGKITTDGQLKGYLKDYCKTDNDRKVLALVAFLFTKYKHNKLITGNGTVKIGKESKVYEKGRFDEKIYTVETDSKGTTLKYKGNETANKLIKIVHDIHTLPECLTNLTKNANTTELILQRFDHIADSDNIETVKVELNGNNKKSNEASSNSRSDILADLQKDVMNMSYGFKTPLVRSFPREEATETAKGRIADYFAGLYSEVKSHLELAQDTVKKDVIEKSKKLNPDDYWNSSIKTASFYNKTIEEGIANKIIDTISRDRREAKQAKIDRRENRKQDFRDNIDRTKQWFKDAKAQQDGKKGSGNDYDFNDEGKSKGESRIEGSFKTYLDTCQHLIDSQEKECDKLLIRARGNVTVTEYRKLTNEITQIMQDTKKKLKEKEDSFEKVILKGNLKKRMQDFVIDKTDVKDPNKNAYYKDQKDLDIKMAADLFNKNEHTNTQRIAKWVLATVLLTKEYETYTPKQILSILEKPFSTLKIGGTFHDNVVYDVGNVNKITEKIGSFTVTRLDGISAVKHYETPIELLRTLDGFRDVKVGNLDLLKDIKSALTNDAFKSNIEPFKQEMEKYFKARITLQNVVKNLAPAPAAATVTNSINTEQYVKKLAESIFNKSNTKVKLIIEDDTTPGTANTGNTPGATEDTSLKALLNKYGAYTHKELSNIFGTGAGKMNFTENGPEDLAAIQQFIHSKLAMLQLGNEYYFISTEVASGQQMSPFDGLVKEIKARNPNPMAEMQKRDKEIVTKQHGELNNGDKLNNIEIDNSAAKAMSGNTDNPGDSWTSVKTEPKATVTTGAVGDVTIPQRMPTPQDVMKRKLNYTTYTYKNGPITVQKRKYDD